MPYGNTMAEVYGVERKHHRRWTHISAQTPEGNALWTCQSCGRTTNTPTDDCPRPVSLTLGGDRRILVPCSEWPVTATAYEQRLMNGNPDNEPCIFTGTVRFYTGEVIEVSAAMHPDFGRQLVLIDTELKMIENKREEILTAQRRATESMEQARQQMLRSARARGINPNLGPGGTIGAGVVGVDPKTGLGSLIAKDGSSLVANEPMWSGNSINSIQELMLTKEQVEQMMSVREQALAERQREQQKAFVMEILKEKEKNKDGGTG